MELFGWIGTILFMVCYIPQLYRTYQTKQVKDVSLVMWLIQWVAYTSCLVYSIAICNKPFMFGYSIGWLMTSWWLELYRQYSKQLYPGEKGILYSVAVHDTQNITTDQLGNANE